MTEDRSGQRSRTPSVDVDRPANAAEGIDGDLAGERVRLVTIPDAADQLGLSRSKLYELIADGELPTVRIGRARRVATQDLVRFVAERRTIG